MLLYELQKMHEKVMLKFEHLRGKLIVFHQIKMDQKSILVTLLSEAGTKNPAVQRRRLTDGR